MVKITRLFVEIPILSLRRRQLERKSTKKHLAGGPQIAQKSILGRLGRPKPFRGRVRTRSGRLLDAPITPQSRSGDAPGGPRAARSRRKASPGRLRDALRASGTPAKTLVSPVRVAKRSQKRWRIDLRTFSVDSQQLRSVFRIAPASVLSMSDVLRIERLPHAKTLKQHPFRAPKSRPGASWGPLGEQV